NMAYQKTFTLEQVLENLDQDDQEDFESDTESSSSDEEQLPWCVRKQRKPQAPCTSKASAGPTSKSPPPPQSLSSGARVTRSRVGLKSSSAAIQHASKLRKVTQKRSRFAVHSEQQMDKWHNLSDKDEAPPMHSFAPKWPPGPQLITDELYSPIQLFQLFFSHRVVLVIIANTNAHAEKLSISGKKFNWETLTLDEFNSYLSLIIYMGLVKVKELSDYWSKRLGYDFNFPPSVMSQDRFLSISWALHLCDLKGDEENQQKKGTEEYDPLLQNKHVSIDERMVATKSRIGLKQYMKAKPTKCGFKLFVLAELLSGYTWDFSVYEEKRATHSDKGLSYDSLMSLLDFPLLGTGYKLYVDNFYTSPELFKDLAGLQRGACGTIRTTRKGFSKARENDMAKKAEGGTIRWLKEPLLVKWMDTREVVMCSSINTAYEGDTVNRRVKVDQCQWTRKTIPIPGSVLEYNKYMEEVDQSDALISYYNVLHKTRKWYKKLFQHLLDIAIVNAFILHKEQMMAKCLLPLTQKAFREKHMKELLEAAQPETTPQQPSQMCMPAYLQEDATKGCKRCVRCHTKTPVYCTKCNVSLCFVPSRNCFQD
uniref:PiggyBac transposable element-derived protein domain-containing protein n=1 Tax=Cyprinus carpio TaxID=7962 RepID=A0A8C1M6X0_CYPCA